MRKLKIRYPAIKVGDDLVKSPGAALDELLADDGILVRLEKDGETQV